MPPAPSLATYQTAAQSTYAPQLASDITTAEATTASDIANLEAGKGQINTDYQTAVDNLTSSTNSNVAKINQLYTQRLGGNFSGLQGNDLGSMFGKAAQARGIIESTRANKLTAITTGETNASNTLNANISALTSKYKGLEASSAQSAYTAATKAATTQANSDRTYGLSVAKFNLSASKAATTAAAAVGKGYHVSQLSSGNKAYVGPNGQTNLYQYATATNSGNASGTYNTILSELKTGSSTDKAAYNKVSGMSTNAGIKYLQKNNSYIFD